MTSVRCISWAAVTVLVACGGTSGPTPDPGAQPPVEATPDDVTTNDGATAEVTNSPRAEAGDAALAEGLAAVCACPSGIEAERPEERGAALSRCIDENATSPTLADWKGSLADWSTEEKLRSLRELMRSAGVRDCDLETVWNDSEGD